MLLALGAAVALMPSLSKAQIGLVGSTHDFSSGTNGYATYIWGGSTNTYNNPCQICHIPHKAPQASLTQAPLWNHAASQNSTYVTYDQGGSATFNALNLTVSLGSSVACLSCHDGSMAVNESYGATGPSQNGTTVGATAFYVPSFAVETATPGSGTFVRASGSGPWTGRNDLTHMHPIGVSYTAAEAADPTLNAHATLPVPQMLKGPTMTVECASCHDIHRVYGASSTVSHDLIVDLNNAALCQTCHKQ